MQVHDELVFEVPDGRGRRRPRRSARKIMEARRRRCAVPLVVDVGVGANWDEAH